MAELTTWFPIAFDSWDNTPSCASPLDPILAVNLARLTDDRPVLTIALYLCCQLDATDLLRGRVRSGDVVDRLSDEDLACCMRGKAACCTRKVQMIRGVFAHIDNPACTGGLKRCNASLDYIMAQQSRCAEAGDANVLDPRCHAILRRHRQSRKPKPKSPLCSSCIALVTERETGIRASLWSDLPDLLGFKQRE